jgi:hypothetical protein
MMAPLSRPVMLRIDPATYEEIVALAELERWTVSQAARVLLERGLEAYRREAKSEP